MVAAVPPLRWLTRWPRSSTSRWTGVLTTVKICPESTCQPYTMRSLAMRSKWSWLEARSPERPAVCNLFFVCIELLGKSFFHFPVKARVQFNTKSPTVYRYVENWYRRKICKKKFFLKYLKVFKTQNKELKCLMIICYDSKKTFSPWYTVWFLTEDTQAIVQ